MRRGATFVTRKVARGMWRMPQDPEPQDYVLAINAAYSVRDFVRMAFGHAGL